jgi:MFS family permease
VLDDAARKRVLGIVFLTLFLDLVGFGILIPIQPFYAQAFGASPKVITLLSASYSAMQFVFAPLWGRLSDRIGRRPVVLISVAFGGLGFLVFGLANSLWMLFLARMIAGFGNANIGTVQAIVADVTSGKDRAKGMGLIGAAFGLGFIFGPIIGGVFGGLYGPTVPAFIAAGLAVLNWFLALVRMPETRKPGPVDSHMRRSFFDVGALGRALRFDNVLQLLALAFIVTAGFSLMETALALFIGHHWAGGVDVAVVQLNGMTDAQKHAVKLTTYVMLCVGISAAVVQGGLIRQLRKRANERSLIRWGVVILFVALLLLPVVGWVDSYALMFPVAALLSLGSGIMQPSQSSLLSQSVPEDEQGGALGVGQSLSALGRVAGPALSGVLFEVRDDVPFLAGAGFMAVAFVVAMTMKPQSLTPPVDTAALH